MENKKRKIALFGIGGLLVLFFVIGVSYAVWQLVLEQTNENVVTSGCFKINFIEKNDIQLDNAYPIIDVEGKKLTPYEFTIENTCDSQASFQVNLEILNTTTLMRLEYIKIMFDEGAPKILTSYNETEKTLVNATTSYKLNTGILEANESKTFTLRLWMDEDTPPVSDAMNKVFKSKVTITTSYIAPVDTTNMIAERFTLPDGKTLEDVLNDESWELPVQFLSSDKYSFMGESKKIIFQNEINPIEGITPIDMSINQDKSVLAYKDESNEEEIITYIQANGIIKLPENSVFVFGNPFIDNLITSIEGMEYLDTQYIIDMRGMFCNCRSLTNLDLSLFKTDKVIDMSEMFANCPGLTTLNLSNFNTMNVTDMSSMFQSCSSLTSLDLSAFDTAKVTNMAYMFNNCSGLTSLDLSPLDTTNVTYMNDMFARMRSLTNLDLSSFKTDKVIDMSRMFTNCLGLTTLNLSNFNTMNVTDMGSMFRGCSGLTGLDISSFNTSNVTDMSDMFTDCSNLTTITYGENFIYKSGATTTNMFSNCTANKPTHESWNEVTFS